METKVVYVVISKETDIYLNQAFISAYSLKLFNPEAHITIVMDDLTCDVLQSEKYEEFRSIISETIVERFSDSISNMERSRLLKTTLRNRIDGNYLFIDTDTVICGDLSDIDKIKSEIAAVPDKHRNRSQFPYMNFVVSNFKQIFHKSISACSVNYFNSGVMFVKDTPNTREFYKEWNKKYMECDAKGFKYDQLALFATDIEKGGMIEEMDGIFNCQVTTSIRYLHTAKILHFFQEQDYNAGIHPFLTKKWYAEIIKDNKLTDSVKRDIINCKSLFSVPSVISGAGFLPVKYTNSLLWYLRLQPKALLQRFKKRK